MSLLDTMQPTAATAATLSNMRTDRPAAALPSASGGAAVNGGFSGSNFASTFQQVQSDIAAFINHGGGASLDDSPATTMGAQALALRARLANPASPAASDGGAAIDSGVASADADLQQQFLASIQPWAEQAGARLGVAPNLVAAHAALESGWGQHPLRAAGGASSNNLFGVKAGGQWQGAVAAASTTEYQNGAALKKVERFRSYPDTASAFRDYADMLSNNPRFQGALNAGNDARAFAAGLAQGGYATDPAYADKLSKLAAQMQQHGGAAAAVIHQSGD